MDKSVLSINNPIDQARLNQLREAAGAGPVLIVTHDNPDPDALASGMGISTLLLQAWNIPNRMVYSGLIGRAENHAVLSLLTPDWQQEDQIANLSGYSAVALGSRSGPSRPFVRRRRRPAHTNRAAPTAGVPACST